MFNNIGSKIKAVAQVITWIGIISSIIGGIVIMALQESPIGVLVIIGGSFISWLSSLTLYGFGQLIENTDIIAERNKADNTSKSDAKADETQSSADIDEKSGKLGTCEFCDKKDVKVVYCKIVDSMGTRYRNLCADCMAKHNAVPYHK